MSSTLGRHDFIFLKQKKIIWLKIMPSVLQYDSNQCLLRETNFCWWCFIFQQSLFLFLQLYLMPHMASFTLRSFRWFEQHITRQVVIKYQSKRHFLMYFNIKRKKKLEKFKFTVLEIYWDFTKEKNNLFLALLML